MNKTIWESDAKNPNGEPYLKVQTDGGYVWSERLGKDSIAFVLVDYDKGLVGLIHERKPPLGKDEFRTTAFGGSLDKCVSPVQICIEEVAEEAGFTITEDNITSYGKVFVSTQMNQHCHLYIVDVSGLEAGERCPDENEVSSEVRWLTDHEAIHIDDWKTATILFRAAMGWRPW